MKQVVSQNWIILLILFIGFCLRFYGINQKSFYEDEAYSLQQISDLSFGQLAFTIFDPGHTPLYYLLTKWLTQFLGISEFSLRILSAGASFLSIWFIYQVGKIIYSETVGMMAAALLTFSPLSVVYGQMARPYGLFTLWAIASLYAFIQYFRTKKLLFFLFFFLICFLGLATHGLFLTVLAAYLLFLILSARKMPLWEIGKWGVGLVILSILFYQFLLDRYLAAFLYKSAPDVLSLSVWVRIAVAFFGLTLGETVNPFNWPVVLPAIISFGITGIAGTLYSLRSRNPWIILVLVCLFLPLAAWIYLGANSPRLISYAVPFFLLLISFGIDKVPWPRVWKFVLFLFIVIPQTISVYFWHTGNPNQFFNANLLIPWKEIAQDIQKEKKSGEMVLLHPDTYLPLIQYYSPKEGGHWVALPEEGFEKKLKKTLEVKPDSFWLLSGPNSTQGKKIRMENFSCYQPIYQKGYTLNPVLVDFLKFGIKKEVFATQIYHWQRLPKCNEDT
ncbi:MAG: hypothetical protein A2W61_08310 [Deltaproteobacteria bacterium RIFCSPLOWO2_01_44_7]|nr:MAG: hypothetical protein A2712_02270 [Deltaproteobacteria bacterium RIFCSPHIGHO2_01_FULL_43_49]OGQ15050.1 MAG: hypothetical protein A3D22_03210 [Deltaproteobacteria bacterium RIFCSPHIGHO2_02_FULL_44_53]OGQ27331.1 MAG: hypothetical protein A3D98_02865 [Deltaproteobacteria bacterium RIFCSPHIGHO2_12_FULL_44_21]OGQ31567.1 MAG: hypothetical protein A2979_04370 [Deltaproteobacteria bacterium RIFCSPLOWO2_01_FULL_45_74]OGQ42622.1 MAG: hypothetical protein A2W61_08310 [Deltaproteobacteria bacterium 